MLQLRAELRSLGYDDEDLAAYSECSFERTLVGAPATGQPGILEKQRKLLADVTNILGVSVAAVSGYCLRNLELLLAARGGQEVDAAAVRRVRIEEALKDESNRVRLDDGMTLEELFRGNTRKLSAFLLRLEIILGRKFCDPCLACEKLRKLTVGGILWGGGQELPEMA